RSVSDDGPFASVPEIALSDLSIAELVDLAHELNAVRFGHMTLAEEAALVAAHAASGRPLALSHILDERSEEHTSELPSRFARVRVLPFPTRRSSDLTVGQR